MTECDLYFTAGEPSGDLLGAEVVDALKARAPQLQFRATGRHELAARASGPDVDLTALDIVGFSEGIRAYGDVVRISSAIAEDIVAHKPRAVVLVDAWGLSIRIARKVRARDPSIRLIKLVGPQVWATRAGRARTLAKAVDHLLCMHEFEMPYYRSFGLPVTVIGHPALARMERLDGAGFRRDHGLAEDDPFLLVLPGSRGSEINRVAGPLVEAAKRLQGLRPGLRVCVAPAAAVLPQFRDRFDDLPEDWLVLSDDSRRYEAMAAAALALSCSGTVNNELAMQGTPFVTGYGIGQLTWLALKYFLLRTEFITLLNVAAGRMVAPELLQGDLTPDNLVAAALPRLDDTAERRAQIVAQDDALDMMGRGGQSAVEIAAGAILDDLQDAPA